MHTLNNLKPIVVIVGLRNKINDWRNNLPDTDKHEICETKHLLVTINTDNTFKYQSFEKIDEVPGLMAVNFHCVINLDADYPENILDYLINNKQVSTSYFHRNDNWNLQNNYALKYIEYSHESSNKNWLDIQSILFKDVRSNIREFLHGLINKIKALEWSLPEDLDEFSEFLTSHASELDEDFEKIQKVFQEKNNEIKNLSNTDNKDMLLIDLIKYKKCFEGIKSAWEISRTNLKSLKDAIKQWNDLEKNE